MKSIYFGGAIISLALSVCGCWVMQQALPDQDGGSDGDSDGDMDGDMDGDSDGDSDSDSDGDTDTDSDSDADTEVDTGEPYDCDNLPEGPYEINEMSGPVAYHDVEFTLDGFMVSTDTSALFKTPVLGAPSIFVPNLQGIEGMDFLPGGDLVAADSSWGRVLRISPEGVVTSLTTGFSGGYANPYGVLVGPNGMIYVTGGSNVSRVDPDTGAKETIVTISDGSGYPDLRAVNFSLDYSVMYISAISQYGDIYAVDMDGELNPIGDPYIFVSGVGEYNPEWGLSSWHDGLGIDACGNLYVPDYISWALYRITPEGDISKIIDWGDSAGYGHGLKWGSGVGGWTYQAVFMPQPYDSLTLVEVFLGVPSRKFDWE